MSVIIFRVVFKLLLEAMHSSIYCCPAAFLCENVRYECEDREVGEQEQFDKPISGFFCAGDIMCTCLPSGY